MEKEAPQKGKDGAKPEKTAKRRKYRNPWKRAFTMYCFLPALALILWTQLGAQTFTDILILWVLRFRYLADGLPLAFADKDALYFSSSMWTSLLWAREALESMSVWERQLLHVEPGDDHMTALCKVSMYTQMVTAGIFDGTDPLTPPGMHNWDTMDPVSTIERVNAYVQACKEVYSSLDKEGPQRKILDTLEAKRKVDISTTKPMWMSFAGLEAKRAERSREAARRPSHSHLWKKLDELGDYGHMFANTNIRPIVEDVIDPSEIGEAVRQGRVAKFDAVKLLGKDIFNKSMADIAAMHGDMAKEIPMYRQKGPSAFGRSGMETLEMYASRVAAWKPQKSIRYPESAPWRPAFTSPQDLQDWADGASQPTWWMDVLAEFTSPWLLRVTGMNTGFLLRQVRSTTLQCAVNTRRLPKLPMPSMEDALGNPDWLERAWSMFWLGPVSDCWHYDDPDNLLIGIYGDIWVTVFMHEDGELMRAGADRGCWANVQPMPQRIDQPNTMQTDPWLEKYRFVHFKLTPGTGVVVPSGTFHSLANVDGDRILLNCFMIPKYKGLWDAPAANHSFWSPKWQSEEHHALAQLKRSSIFRLWDTKRLGGFFEGTKLEML